MIKNQQEMKKKQKKMNSLKGTVFFNLQNTFSLTKNQNNMYSGPTQVALCHNMALFEWWQCMLLWSFYREAAGGPQWSQHVGLAWRACPHTWPVQTWPGQWIDLCRPRAIVTSRQGSLKRWVWLVGVVKCADLCAGHSYLWPGIDVHSTVGLPADGTANGIGDANGEGTTRLAVTQSIKCISSLACKREEE